MVSPRWRMCIHMLLQQCPCVTRKCLVIQAAMMQAYAGLNLLRHLSCTTCLSPAAQQIHFFILMSRQGKVRLAKWYSTYSQKERARVVKETTPLVLSRPLKLCNFVDWKNLKLVYKRYASLYFLCGVDSSDNELLVLETIHHFVEVLDMYFGNVCELDLIFNFHKAYYILDELLIAGNSTRSTRSS